jgi:5-methylcytosine-specific restriction protein A
VPAHACSTCGRINATRTCPEHKPNRNRSPSSRRTGNRQWRNTRAAILSRDNYTCQLCGEPATQVDHITTAANHGTDEHSNLRAVCQPCNQARNQQTPAHAALIYGPPASGKTAIARALNTHLSWQYLNIDAARAATKTTSNAAWQHLAHQLDQHTGPTIIEGCNPPDFIHRRLEERGHTTIRAEANAATVQLRLTERGWDSTHAHRVAAEQYDESADFTIHTDLPGEPDLELLIAYLRTAATPLPQPAGQQGRADEPSTTANRRARTHAARRTP